MVSHLLCQGWAGSQRPSCHRLAVCSAQAGGLNCSPGELSTLQQGFFQVRLRPEMPDLPSALKQSSRMLLCSVTPLSQLCHLGRAHCAARSDHSWGRRVFLLGSAWTVKCLEKSQESCYSGMLSLMAGEHHTVCPYSWPPYSTPKGIYLSLCPHDASWHQEKGKRIS